MRRRFKSQRGATTVELAICLPIFFTIIFFFLEAWRFQEFQQSIDQAAFEACRLGIVPGASVATVRAKATSILSAVGASTATITVTPSTITDTTQSINVTVSLNYSDVGWFYQYFPSTSVISSSVTLSHENARLKRTTGS